MKYIHSITGPSLEVKEREYPQVTEAELSVKSESIHIKPVEVDNVEEYEILVHGGIGGKVDDVQINGHTIVSKKIANIHAKRVTTTPVGDIISHNADEFERAHPYISLERLRHLLYKVTFDNLPEDNGGESPVASGCSSYVKDGKLYTNLDWDYDNTASFWMRTRDFEGESFVGGLIDGGMDDDIIAQLPYRVHRGINNHGIKLASHILYNDWSWTGCGQGSINLTRLPFLVLSKVRSMATLESDLEGILDNLYCPDGLAALGYLLQAIVTDGTTTYALIPPTSEGESYEVMDITDCPKLTNFRPVGRATVERTDSDIQAHPTGIERYNMMPCSLEDLRFTKAYEAPTRLSEFIGLRGTDKDSTDAQLEAIYNDARAIYLDRKRDGQTWQTMESAIYSSKGLEALWIQENWDDNIIGGDVTALEERVSAIESKESGWDAKLSDAPSDNKQYARKNGSWSEVATGGSEVQHGTTDYWNSRIGFIPPEG